MYQGEFDKAIGQGRRILVYHHNGVPEVGCAGCICLY